MGEVPRVAGTPSKLQFHEPQEAACHGPNPPHSPRLDLPPRVPRRRRGRPRTGLQRRHRLALRPAAPRLVELRRGGDARRLERHRPDARHRAPARRQGRERDRGDHAAVGGSDLRPPVRQREHDGGRREPPGGHRLRRHQRDRHVQRAGERLLRGPHLRDRTRQQAGVPHGRRRRRVAGPRSDRGRPALGRGAPAERELRAALRRRHERHGDHRHRHQLRGPVAERDPDRAGRLLGQRLLLRGRLGGGLPVRGLRRLRGGLPHDERERRPAERGRLGQRRRRLADALDHGRTREQARPVLPGQQPARQPGGRRSAVYVRRHDPLPRQPDGRDGQRQPDGAEPERLGRPDGELPVLVP